MTPSSYKGVCVHFLSDGTIDHVSVEDISGNRLPLDLDDYIYRGILPPVEDLPDCKKPANGNECLF